MKTRAPMMILPILAVFLVVVVTAYSQEDMTHIDTSDFSRPRRAPSVFPHDQHNEAAVIEACNQCHHVYEDGKKLEDESSEGERCSDCHTLEAQGHQPGLMRAFHMNCMGCHQKQNKGPVMCGECHVKS
ncbi:MAG: cytochrome c3 family protein [Desulfobacterales bacterium]